MARNHKVTQESAETPSSFPVSRKKLADLTQDSRNANKGTARGAQLIQASLRDYGAGRSILLDKHGRIIAGNKTAENAGAIGLDNVLVVQTEGDQLVAVQRMDLDLEDPKARALSIADNRASEVSLDWDIEVLKELATEIALAPFFSPDELEKMWPQNALIGDEDDAPEVPAEPVTKLGDLHALGEHRLLCGDSTSAADVERLMGGTPCNLMVTDPPYGVKLDQSWRDEALGSRSMGPGNKNLVAGDDRADWEAVWRLFAGDVAYIWHASQFTDLVKGSLERAGFETKQQIIWNKSIMVMGRGDYHWKHEPCWYAVRKGKPHGWVGDRKQVTVWDAASPNHIMSGSKEERTDHPAQKPIVLFEIPLNNHTKAGDACFDPFGGSGSTLIACEKTNRRCFMMELSPAYCDVICQRFLNATGKMPTREDGTPWESSE